MDGMETDSRDIYTGNDYRFDVKNEQEDSIIDNSLLFVLTIWENGDPFVKVSIWKGSFV